MRRLTTFTPEQIAEMIGATAWWVREQAKNRNVPHIRAGRGKVMFRESDVLYLLDAMAVQPPRRRPTVSRRHPRGAESAGPDCIAGHARRGAAGRRISACRGPHGPVRPLTRLAFAAVQRPFGRRRRVDVLLRQEVRVAVDGGGD